MMFHHTNAPSATGKKNKSSLNAALRRAFTITELVIVIAVIAILAAVLIPTFTNLVNRANESADIQMVKNLNTILSSEEALGNRADTIEEALEQALDGGYKVENLTPTSDGNDIVWDAVNNRFALVDSDGNKIYGDALTPDPISGQDYWKITNDYSKTSDNTFSWYLTEDAELPTDSASGSLEVTSSINLSAFPDLKSITVSDKAEGTINITTNSEDVEIIASTTTAETAPIINIYGTAGTIAAKNNYGETTGGQFGMNSLHVYGKVEGIYYANGHIVIENGAAVNYIICTQVINSNLDQFNIEVKNDGTLNYLAYSHIFTNSSKLEEIITYENKNPTTTVLTSTNVPDPAQNINAGGVGKIDAPYLLSMNGHLTFINEYNYYNHNETTYFKLTNDLTMNQQFTTQLSDMVLDLAGHTITVKVVQDDTTNPDNPIYSAFKIVSGDNLTIEDSVGGGGIITADAYISEDKVAVDYVFDVIGATSDCVLTINGGTFTGVMSVAQVDNSSSIIVNGGTFSALVPNENDVYYVLNKIDGSEATITVNGGRFKNFDPGKAKTDPAGSATYVSYLGTGCTSTEDNSVAGEKWWVVTK